MAQISASGTEGGGFEKGPAPAPGSCLAWPVSAREGRLPWAWLLRARPGSRLGSKQIPESPFFPPQHTQGWAPSPPSSGEPGFSPALAWGPGPLPSCPLSRPRRSLDQL